MLSQDELRDLAIFLTSFGKDLPNILCDPSRIPRTPKTRLWLESAERLGVIDISGDIIRIRREGIQSLIEKINRAFDHWLDELSRS